MKYSLLSLFWKRTQHGKQWVVLIPLSQEGTRLCAKSEAPTPAASDLLAINPINGLRETFTSLACFIWIKTTE
jgi:hypothetical protein